jgi:cytochrome bd-type quinol oxidase subunit 2
MDTSLFLARLIGPMLLIIGAGVLINRENFRSMAKELVASRELMFIIGVLTLLGGLAIVITHNVWSGWPIVITILGWILAIGGAVRIVFPDTARSIQGAALEKPMMPTIGGGIQALIGAWLCYFGFMA